MLDGEEKFLLLLVHGNSESSMRRVQFAIGPYVAHSLARKNHESINSVVVDRVDIAVARIDIQSALELDFCVQSADEPLGFTGLVGRGLDIPIVNPNIEQILIC